MNHLIRSRIKSGTSRVPSFACLEPARAVRLVAVMAAGDIDRIVALFHYSRSFPFPILLVGHFCKKTSHSWFDFSNSLGDENDTMVIVTNVFQLLSLTCVLRWRIHPKYALPIVIFDSHKIRIQHLSQLPFPLDGNTIFQRTGLIRTDSLVPNIFLLQLFLCQ